MKARNNLAPVSLEEELLHELGLAIGDTVRFSVGGLSFDAVITSTRSLNWDSMTPNFYFLFPEGYLEDYPRTHMTSLYIPSEDKLLVNDLLRKYPTVQVIELDKIIDRIRSIVSQVTRGLEMMTLLILGCGILVMFAAVSLSMNERLQESAILRTLGSSRRLILGVQWVEFTTLGVMAGFLAALGRSLPWLCCSVLCLACLLVAQLAVDCRPAGWRFIGWVVGSCLQSQGGDAATIAGVE